MDRSSFKQPTNNALDSPASGSDDMLLSPSSRECNDKLRSDVVHHHNNDSPFKTLDDKNDDNFTKNIENSDSDQEVLASVYEYLMEVIVTRQSEMGLDSDRLKTPPSAPRTTGIAETCPQAPIKSEGKSRNINVEELCRKLEF